jgi:hypothetical protein
MFLHLKQYSFSLAVNAPHPVMKHLKTVDNSGIFFLNGGQKLCANLLIKESFTKVTKAITRDHSPGMMLPKCLAPALTHKRASALIFSMET